MSETEFISAIVAEADCLLHLDVRTTSTSIAAILASTRWPSRQPSPGSTCYIHVAGHCTEPDGPAGGYPRRRVIDPVGAAGRHTAAPARCRPAWSGISSIPDSDALTAEGGAIGRLRALRQDRQGGRMNAIPELPAVQMAFGRHIRDPRRFARPEGVPVRGMAV